MKKLLIIFLILVIIISCSKKQNKPSIAPVSLEAQLSSTPKALDIDNESNKVFKQWIHYYTTNDTTFSIDKFILKSIDSLRPIPGNIYGTFDKEFDSIYSKCLVYNSDKKKYIDFDSYQWSLGENKVATFSPDQEINLVDIENKKITRIGFRGSSQWVENAFWENDSTIVLLENFNRNQLIINKVNLHQKIIHTYLYKDSLHFESIYPELRLRQKTGIVIN